MNVGLGTYSVEHMTTFEIEQASVAPFRFVDLLDKHLGRGQPLFPCATRAIRPRRDVLREDQRFLLHELAPGGRWLFTLTEDACVHLWDLNADNNSSTLTMPTGSWVHPRGSGQFIHPALYHHECSKRLSIRLRRDSNGDTDSQYDCLPSAYL